MKLISMTDFVTEQMSDKNYYNTMQEKGTDNIEGFILGRIWEYSKFLKQPLTLGMFVPCDNNGDPIELPTDECHPETEEEEEEFVRLYQQAKDRVLFEIDLDRIDGIKYNIERQRTIEYLTSFGIELTPTAIKTIGL